MEFPQMTRRQVQQWLDLVGDPEIAAVREEEAVCAEQDEIDRIVAALDDELAVEQRAVDAEVPKVSRPTRRQRHATRRAEREVVRALPVRVNGVSEIAMDEEAA